jgi:hypothetical protein
MVALFVIWHIFKIYKPNAIEQQEIVDVSKLYVNVNDVHTENKIAERMAMF